MCMLSRFSHVQLFMILWTIAHEGPLSKRFSRQEHWSGLPCSPPWDLLSLRDRSHIYSSSDITDGFLTAEPWGQALENSGPTTILMSGLSHLLLISWLQSPSAMILEPRKIKSDTVSTVSPSISHEGRGSARRLASAGA